MNTYENKPGKLDFNIKSNASLNVDLTMTDQTTGDPVNLIDVECFLMQIRQARLANDVLIDVSAKGYVNIINAAQGVVSINIPAEELVQLKASAFYDLVARYTSGKIKPFLEGKLIISAGVTRGLECE